MVKQTHTTSFLDRLRSNFKIPTGLILTGALLTGCGSGEATSDSDTSGEDASTSSMSPAVSALYEEAKTEGALTWYTSFPEANMTTAVEEFQETFPGLRVDALRLSSGQLSTRYAQESSAESKTADIITQADASFVKQAVVEGWIDPVERDELPAVSALSDEWFNEGTPTTGINALGIVYNTEMVTSEPTEWADILDAQYKNNIIWGDPFTTTTSAYSGGLMYERLGPDFLKDFAAQSPTIVPSLSAGVQRVANGQEAIAVGSTMSTIEHLQASGAPVAITYPEWYPISELLSGISVNSENPAFARLFMNWLLTEEGQVAFIGTGDASPINSEGSVPLTDGAVRPDYDKLEEYRQHIRTAFDPS